MSDSAGQSVGHFYVVGPGSRWGHSLSTESVPRSLDGQSWSSGGFGDVVKIGCNELDELVDVQLCATLSFCVEVLLGE